VNNAPYSPIVARNIFGLLPIPTNPPVDPNPTPTTPPPKITPNGFMNLFNVAQVLFKVAYPPAAGQPAHDQSYVLAEGESQDNIEVTKIDQASGMITFNNNGVVQELALAAAPKITTPASPITNPGGAIGGGPSPNSGGIPRPVFGGGAAGLRNRLAAAAGTANPNGDSTGGFGNGGDSELAGLSPEAQVLVIEQNRINDQDKVNSGQLPPYPPTPITPADATGPDGSPLETSRVR
jgi:hypothetical protein